MPAPSEDAYEEPPLVTPSTTTSSYPPPSQNPFNTPRMTKPSLQDRLSPLVGNVRSAAPTGSPTGGNEKETMHKGDHEETSAKRLAESESDPSGLDDESRNGDNAIVGLGLPNFRTSASTTSMSTSISEKSNNIENDPNTASASGTIPSTPNPTFSLLPHEPVTPIRSNHNPSSPATNSASGSANQRTILALLVVDFNHLQGPVIDYVWPTMNGISVGGSGSASGSGAGASIPPTASTGFSSPAVFSDRDENGRRRDGRGESSRRSGLGEGNGEEEERRESGIERALRRDEELARRLPFLALPDGAHLSEEDYSYFHCIYDPPPSSDPRDLDDHLLPDSLPVRQTIFGISCNRQIPASDLLYRPPDVTRSTVQKAVVVLASRPVFGPIRDKLGVVTRAFFAQRDFTRTELLPQFYASLEKGFGEKVADDSGMYMGTSLRELLHTFRHKTLTLVKLMMLQKRIMLYGYPVERLCTYQYSLISLMPGLLLNLGDAADPSLDFRTGPTKRPSSLRTSDRNSLLRYMGLPLHTFGKDAFFQPYLPLQQIDMLSAKSWLVGTTNSIVTQQRDCQWDLLINIQETSFEFFDPKIERLVSLTSSDRLWMDQVVKAVEETWNPADPTRPIGLVYRGSDDDLRNRFEEYICSALATLKYQDFLASGQTGIPIMPGELRVNVAEPFSVKWLETFKETNSYKIWNETTDELLFDICEPRHPCEGKTNAVSDIGIRLAEGIHDLRLDKQFDTGKEVIGTAALAASNTLLSALSGVRSEVASRMAKPAATGSPISPNTRPASVFLNNPTARDLHTESSPPHPIPTSSSAMPDVRATLGGWGSFLGSKVQSLSHAAQAAAYSRGSAVTPATPTESTKSGLRELNLVNRKESLSSPEKKRDTM